MKFTIPYSVIAPLALLAATLPAHAADAPAQQHDSRPSIAQTKFQSSPFEDRNFDPDNEPLLETVMQPGKPSDFEMFIPFPAGTRGLRVRFRVVGRDSSLLKAYVRVGVKDQPVPMHGGAFDVVVPEGGKQLLVWLLWDGRPASGEPMAMDSTILDPMGKPTHATRLMGSLRLAKPAQ